MCQPDNALTYTYCGILAAQIAELLIYTQSSATRHAAEHDKHNEKYVMQSNNMRCKKNSQYIGANNRRLEKRNTVQEFYTNRPEESRHRRFYHLESGHLFGIN